MAEIKENVRDNWEDISEWCDIVEILKSAMSSGNVVSATRYYGIYVVLMDVQISCYEAYLEKKQTRRMAAKIERS